MNKARVALSSLAVSVSAVALLGISGTAAADPPYCNTGNTCGLGSNAHTFIISEGGQEGTDYYEDYGSCAYYSGQCGCAGGVGGGPIYSYQNGNLTYVGWVEPDDVFQPSAECHS